MSSLRPTRVAEQMKKEVAQIIRDEVKDPRVGFVTVTAVEVSKDLRHAKIYVSVYGSEQEKKNSLEGLQKATSFVRRELGRRIKLRHVPEIEFRFDQSIEHGAHIAKLLSEVSAKEVRDDD